MAELTELREQIDEVDAQIFNLFTRRMTISDEIAAAKAEQVLPTLDSSREQEKIASARASVPEDLADHAQALMEFLMAASRARQDARRAATDALDNS